MLLVTSSRRPEHWIVPGGGVEPEEEASVTAIREVLEEAGVLGKLGRSLGVFEVRVRTFACTTEFYLNSQKEQHRDRSDLRLLKSASDNRSKLLNKTFASL